MSISLTLGASTPGVGLHTVVHPGGLAPLKPSAFCCVIALLVGNGALLMIHTLLDSTPQACGSSWRGARGADSPPFSLSHAIPRSDLRCLGYPSCLYAVAPRVCGFVAAPHVTTTINATDRSMHRMPYKCSIAFMTVPIMHLDVS